jgi:hypothetical protein
MTLEGKAKRNFDENYETIFGKGRKAPAESPPEESPKVKATLSESPKVKPAMPQRMPNGRFIPKEYKETPGVPETVHFNKLTESEQARMLFTPLPIGDLGPTVGEPDKRGDAQPLDFGTVKKGP